MMGPNWRIEGHQRLSSPTAGMPASYTSHIAGEGDAVDPEDPRGERCLMSLRY